MKFDVTQSLVSRGPDRHTAMSSPYMEQSLGLNVLQVCHGTCCTRQVSLYSPSKSATYLDLSTSMGDPIATLDLVEIEKICGDTGMPACAFSESQIGRCCMCLCRFIQRQLDTQWSSTVSSLFDL